ncbi:MAG: hypothetical protein IRY85_20760, partial [Micromonosporaceae bacterium]|nr:hypothetical protein [Micromonosporaceae bacterium]
DIAEARLTRRLVAVTRDTPPPPGLTALLAAVKHHEREISARADGRRRADR